MCMHSLIFININLNWETRICGFKDRFLRVLVCRLNKTTTLTG